MSEIELIRRLNQLERELTLAIFALCNGDRERTSRALGIDLGTLFDRLHQYGLEGVEFDEEGRAFVSAPDARFGSGK